MQKTLLKQCTGKLQTGGKYLQTGYLTKDLNAEHIQSSQNSKVNKQTTQLKNEEKTVNEQTIHQRGYIDSK